MSGDQFKALFRIAWPHRHEDVDLWNALAELVCVERERRAEIWVHNLTGEAAS